MLHIVVQKIRVIGRLSFGVVGRFQPADRVLVGVVQRRLIGINLVGDPALDVAHPARPILIWIGNSLQAAAVAPNVDGDPIERVLSNNQAAQRIVELPAPAPETVARPFGVEPIVGRLFISAVGVGNLRHPVQRPGWVTTDGIVVNREEVAFRIRRRAQAT